MRQVRVVLFATVLLHSVEASGYRFEFKTTLNGERISGSEVCLYKGHDLESPPSTYLVSDDIRCFPADKVIDVPSGVWAFYAIHSDGWISAHGAAMRRDTTPRDKGYKSLIVELEPSATISFEQVVRTSDRFVAYLPASGDAKRATAVFPLPAGKSTLVVPAKRAFVILRVRDGRPIGAGPLTRANPGEVIQAGAIIPGAERRDLIAWIRIADSSLPDMEHLEAPVVRLHDDRGAEYRPLNDPTRAGSAHKSLVIFSSIPPGKAELRLGGTHWKTTSYSVTIPGEGGIFVGSPLVARLRQRVSLTWSLPFASEMLDDPPTDCTEPAATVTRWSAQLLSCPNGQPTNPPESARIDQCRVEREETIDPSQSGSITFDVRTAGSYVLVLRTVRRLVGITRATVERDADVTVDLPIAAPVLRGTVTEGRNPVKALLRFASGAALTDELGYYEVVLERDPLQNSIEILPCDGSGSFEHIPETPILGSGFYDIALPGNRIEVEVVDSRGPVASATVSRGLFPTKAEAGDAVLPGGEAVDDRGRIVLRRLQPGYFLRVCASAPGHSTSCAEPITVDGDTRRHVTITLAPRELRQGRVLTGIPLVNGILFRATRDGRILEERRIEREGSFVYDGDLVAEQIVVTAANYPMFTAPHRIVADGSDLEIPVPPGTVRTFSVAVSESASYRSGFFTLGIGEFRVPVDALAVHLTRRGLSNYIQDGGPVRVADILETGGLQVVAALGDWKGKAEEPFLAPQYAPFLRTLQVPKDGRVTFPP